MSDYIYNGMYDYMMRAQSAESDAEAPTPQLVQVSGDFLDLQGTIIAGSNTASPASEVVTINNAGSGDLTWTASVNASWLSVSASSGTAPSSLTLTANPAGIPDGSALSATLTVVAPAQGGQPEQTLTIPVNLGKGLSLYTGLGSNGPPPAQHVVYLPFVQNYYTRRAK